MKKMNYRKSSKIVSNIVMIFVSILYFFPLWFFFNNAFKKANFITREPFFITPESFTLRSIIDAFGLIKYPQAFLNSLCIFAISCTLLIIFGSLAAYAIVIVGGKGMNRLYIFMVAMITVPIQVAMVPLTVMLNNMGLKSSYLGTSIVYIAFGLPFVIFIYAGYIRSLPRSLEEAATVDGCGMFKTYILIYMPLLKVVTGTVLILRGLYIWNDVLIPLITISQSRKSTLPLKLINFSTGHGTKWDLMFGASFLISLPVIMMFLAFQKSFVKGIVAGSLKG